MVQWFIICSVRFEGRVEESLKTMPREQCPSSLINYVNLFIFLCLGGMIYVKVIGEILTDFDNYSRRGLP